LNLSEINYSTIEKECLSFNVLREYRIQLGHMQNAIISTGDTEVKEVVVINDKNRKYLYAFTEYSCNQSPTYKTMYETLINVKNICVKEHITF